MIKNVNSGKYLDVAGGTAANGTNVQNAQRKVSAVGGIRGRNAVRSGSRESITSARDAMKDKQESITSSGTYQRAHRQDK